MEDLQLDDEDSNGFLPLEQIQKVWKYSQFPVLDEELTEFMEFLALRCSSSLKKVSYEEFCKAFEDGFALEDCEHDDETPFDVEANEPDEDDLNKIQQKRDAKAKAEAGGVDIEESSPGQAGAEDDEEDPDISSDDLMLYIDEALFKIVATLPEKRKKATLNQRMLPLARATVDTQT